MHAPSFAAADCFFRPATDPIPRPTRILALELLDLRTLPFVVTNGKLPIANCHWKMLFAFCFCESPLHK
jgi:hypothetical protein